MNKRTSLGFTPSCSTASRRFLPLAPTDPLRGGPRPHTGAPPPPRLHSDPTPPREGAIFLLLVCPEAYSPSRASFPQATPSAPSPISSASAPHSPAPTPPFRCRSWAWTLAWGRPAPRATPLSPTGPLRRGGRTGGAWGGVSPSVLSVDWPGSGEGARLQPGSRPRVSAEHSSRKLFQHR